MPWGQSVERKELLNGDKGEGKMDGVHGRGVLSALH